LQIKFSKGGAELKNLLKSNGFSLLELLVALVILSVSLLALAGLMTTTTKNNAQGGHLTEAATLAQDKLEELRARPDSIPLNRTSMDNQISSTGMQYTRRWTGTQNGTNPNLTEVEIIITWSDTINHSLRFFTLIS